MIDDTKPPDVIVPPAPTAPVQPDPTLNMMTSTLALVVVPAADASTDPAYPGLTKVNLKEKICINGNVQGPGTDIWVPTEAFAIWGPAQAKE